MSLGDILFGRKKLKDSAEERLFAITTAQVTLETELGLKPSGSAAVCFKPLSAGAFAQVERDLRQLLDVVARGSDASVDRRLDDFGFAWLVVRDPAFESLVATIHLIAAELEQSGFGGQLLAAVFRFDGGPHPVYWIYGFKRGAFWPFVPTGTDQERDNAAELELKAKLERELPVEQDLTRWFGLFGAPV
jgi:hypothetical protein